MKKKIKILHAITRLDKGGSATNTLLSTIKLRERGYCVDLMYGNTSRWDGGLVERAREAGVRFIYEKALVRSVHPVSDIKALISITNIMRRNDYDIVHAHSSKAGLICRIAAKAAGAKKIVYTPHGHVFYGYFGKAFTRAIIIAEKVSALYTDRIIGLTDSECGEWIDHGVGRACQYVSIPSGIDFDFLRMGLNDMGSDAVGGVKKKGVLIGSIGRFIEIKGYEYLIGAVSEQVRKGSDVYLLLMGDGPLRDKYLDMAKDLGISERLSLIPWQDNVAPMLDMIDIFVLSSLNEGMGRVIPEAMYFAKPVIATRVGGIPSVLSENTGILVEPASSREISEAISRLLEDSGFSRDMGNKGREKVLKEYSVNTMAEKLDSLYRELLEMPDRRT